MKTAICLLLLSAHLVFAWGPDHLRLYTETNGTTICFGPECQTNSVVLRYGDGGYSIERWDVQGLSQPTLEMLPTDEQVAAWQASNRLAVIAAQQAAMIPTLTNHPTFVPPGGLQYKLVYGTNIMWWIARERDGISSQLSAHDAQGRSIIKSRNLKTGEEKVIPIEENTVDPAVLRAIRVDLRTIRTNLVTAIDQTTANISDCAAIQAAATNNTGAAAQGRQIEDLARELEQANRRLKDVSQELQSLRAIVRDVVKGTD